MYHRFYMLHSFLAFPRYVSCQPCKHGQEEVRLGRWRLCVCCVLCARVCVCVCARACACACVRVCVRVRVC